MYQHKIVTDLLFEPVSLEECKEFMEIDFPDFDNLITRLIKSARIASEKFTGYSYGKKTIAVVSNQCKVQLPYGPFISVVSLKDKDGNDISADNYSIFGLDNPIITVGNTITPINYDPYYDILGTALRAYNEWTLEYEAGYEELPEDFKHAICMRVETAFKYRADGTPEQVNKAINTSTEIEFAYRNNPIM